MSSSLHHNGCYVPPYELSSDGENLSDPTERLVLELLEFGDQAIRFRAISRGIERVVVVGIHGRRGVLFPHVLVEDGESLGEPALDAMVRTRATELLALRRGIGSRSTQHA